MAIAHRATAGMGKPLVFRTVAALIGIETLGGQQLFQRSESPWLPGSFSAYDYIVSALVALFIIGVSPTLGYRRLERRWST
jgi:hypothetical protein